MRGYNILAVLVFLLFSASATQACVINGTSVKFGASVELDECGVLSILSYSLDDTKLIAGKTVQASLSVSSGGYGINDVWVRYTDTNVVSDGSPGVNIIDWNTGGVTPGTYNVAGCVNDTNTAELCSSNLSVTIYVPLNSSATEYFGTFLEGKPFQAARDVYEDTMSGLFWPFIMAIIFIATMIRTASFLYSGMILMVMIAALNINDYVHSDVQNIFYAIFALVLGITLYRIMSPTVSE